jgi:pimeloyl-[acyl-carrier protein] methyl ester esterase
VHPPTAILLPGLDGTCDLFAPFAAAAPSRFALRSLPLPHDKPYTYRELSEWVETQLPPGPVALIAESFSGPLAVLLAARCTRVIAVVLCATFVTTPVRVLLPLVPQAIWKYPPPASIMSLFLSAGDRQIARSARSALGALSAEVVASRIAAIASVDVASELTGLSCPVLYLQATHDRLVGGRSAERIRTARPSTEFVRVAGPHLLLQTRPEHAWSHIAPFLDRAFVTTAP